MKKRILLVILFLIQIQTCFPVNQESDENQNLTKVRLQLKWKHQFQFAGYYAAIEQGFYQEEGIEVELLEAVSGEEPGLSVFNGKADFGISTSDVVLMRNDGYDPVVLATIFQHSAQVLLTSTESGTEHIHQLKGKRIAIEPHAADIITYMNDEGVTLDQCTIINHTFTPDQLINGDVDAITGYITDEPYLLNQKNYDFRIISPQMGGIDFYGDLLFCSQAFFKKNPDLVEAFVAASLKGWEYALANPEELIQTIYNDYSKRHSIGHLRYEANHTKNLIMPHVVEIGYTNPGRWKSIVDIYEQANLLKNKKVLDGLLYANYIQEEKDFPWKMFFLFFALVVIISSISIFFYSLSQKLRKQIRLRIETENELNESERKLASIVQHLPGMIFRCKNDENWTMEYLNENCFELTGYKASEIIENSEISYNEVIYPEDRDYVDEVVQTGLANHKSYEINYRILTRDKQIKWVWEKGNGKFSEDDELLFIEGLIIDISDRILAEQELKKYRENLEEMVNERTKELQATNKELEKYNELFIGREFRIKELREKIKELERNQKDTE